MSRLPWTTHVPEGWTVVALKRASKITLGKMLQSGPSGPSDVEAFYLRAANVQPDGLLMASEDDLKRMWFSPSEIEELGLNAGDVVVVEGGIGGYGRSAVLSHDLPGVHFQNSINRARPHIGVDGRFINYCLLTARKMRFIQAYCQSVSMPHLTAEKLAALRIPLPSAKRQGEIADFLDRETAKIDALIAQQQELGTTLAEHRAALIRHAVLQGLDPNASFADSGVAWIGKTPASWPIDKLGRRTSIGNGSTPKRENADYWDDGSYPWLNSSVVNRSLVTEPSGFVTEDALSECHLPRVPAGSVLVGLTGEGRTRGMATLLGIEATINQHVAFITPQPRFWHAPYLLQLLTAGYEALRAQSDENGSTKGALTCADLAAFRIPRPPLTTQREIAEHVSRETKKVDRLVDKTQEVIEAITERRAALISAAVTGQIDVATYGRRD